MFKKIIHLALAATLILLFVRPNTTISAADPEVIVYTVDSLLDLPDFAHNSVCSAGSPANGPCTLRAALMEASRCPESACPEGVNIQIPAGTYAVTIPPVDPYINTDADGDLDIANSFGVQITLEGAANGQTVISANNGDRVFDIAGNGLVVFRNLVIRGGRLQLQGSFMPTGAGIFNYGTLELQQVTLEDNRLTCLPPDDGNCYQAVGGAIKNHGTLLINMSTIRNNQAARGGGIFNTIGAGGVLRILNTSIHDDLAIWAGGGLQNYATVSILNSTISNNVSQYYYGGVVNDGVGTMSLANVTIASNYGRYYGGGNLYNVSTLRIRNSIIADPLGEAGQNNCHDSSAAGWTSTGYNLYSDASCAVTGTGDLASTDPRLSPLGDFGGWNLTRALLAGSPAHDRRPGYCTEFDTGFTITTDQRGANRNALCDIGAFEGVGHLLFLPVVRR